MSKITKVVARQIFDSRGNPTVEAEVFVKKISSSAICPSGASTGSFEAHEKRDKNRKDYNGKSVFNAVKVINKIIAKKLKNKSVHDQEKIDHILLQLDGTKQKTKLGANSMLAVSMAVKKLSSKIKKIPLYKNFIVKNNFSLPYPLMNIINGGVHANNGLQIQEFMIRPDGARSFTKAVKMCFLVITNLRKILEKMKLSTSVGDEGGFAPMISNNNQALLLITKAIKMSKLVNGKDVSICLDVAANELKEGKTIEYYEKLIKKYPIKSIEDPFSEDDWTSWTKLSRLVDIQIVGDDLFATNPKRLEKGIKEKSANAILVKLNQIGTITETLKVIKIAQNSGLKTIISHRSGDSEDTFIADFAVATNSSQIKAGSLARSERVSKYNRLLRIEEELGNSIKMAKI